MPDKIYLLALGDYLDGTLPGFAYDNEGLIEMAERYIREYHYFEDKPLCITIVGNKVLIVEPDGCEHDYTIHTIERVER
jgi:hypothetical protein